MQYLLFVLEKHITYIKNLMIAQLQLTQNRKYIYFVCI